ncbi:unnamed protein product [Bemisia tabaci]|uniref:UNC93-like protein MFSD11 n=1 Tax=Bemisia tabaci TaxID=7038 RepID=A0A9P0F2K1_BEMTA|nr:unnamed protein product [Bemisia tabaci]
MRSRLCLLRCLRLLRIFNMDLDKRFVNVLLLGLGFMFVFTAFQTMGNIEKTILDSIPGFTGNGFWSLAIIYGVFAITNWATPSIISLIGPRMAMVIGAVTYATFIASFFFPSAWLLYLVSGIVGFGAALIWTGQGNYLTINADASTLARDSGVFWALMQSSMFLGNTFVYIAFQGKESIDSDTRTFVLIVLTAVSIVGIVFFAFLPPPISVDGELANKREAGPLAAFINSISLLSTQDMLLLCLTFFYSGLELSFYSGVYGTCLGKIKHFGDAAKQLVGMNGIFVGFGEVLGGLFFGIMGKKTARWGRDAIVIAGFIIHILSFFLIFLNVPNDATISKDTTIESYITPNKFIAILCSFLLGFGDSIFSTQIYSILGSMYSEDSAPAFAVFKFMQSIAAAISFFYSDTFYLTVQLSLLVIFATIGTASFCIVEYTAKKRGDPSPSHVSQTTSLSDKISTES